ncbi:MAG: helix-turn-helix transcriptional regulator [Actinomycetota bacterium]
MVNSGHDAAPRRIRQVEFHSRAHPGVPVEVLNRADLITRFGARFFDRPDRPAFDGLLLIHDGTGTHTVDFETIALRPGRLIRTRPGQVQSWDTEADIQASLVIAGPVPETGSAWFPGHRAYCDLDDDELLTADNIVAALRREQARFDGNEPSTRLLIGLYTALGALFDRATEILEPAATADPYTAFRLALETDLGRSHNVREYAGALGYAERTISRACQRATGLTAKGVLDQRLVLEAKRLLAHTDMAAAAISGNLGFSEPTNFTKFFVRRTGQRPSEFRSSVRSG